MTAGRKATVFALLGLGPLALTALTATPAAAHGSMSDPVSRVAACYAEGPEHPTSAACKAAVQAGGAQALYDWNAVRDGNAGGRSKERIPDGKLCSAGNDEYKGLDLARADWPSTPMKAGRHTFHYKATAPHKGTFELYLTKDGYDPAKPLKWSDLEARPFAKVTDPALTNGSYVFDGTVPARSGRHLIYSIWQRSDSPEAFYTCSDVVFGKAGRGAAAASAPTAAAPTDRQIAAGAGRSSMDMGHHGHAMGAAGGAHPDGASVPVGGKHLAETGGDGSTVPLAVGGAAVLALGAGVLFAAARRRAARQG
ncbi:MULTISPECIES: lytic polysaccharide monooxygenase [unclassified Streptomyces]|uniref:lytic polysaccharide monooxygenase n=1 Tax=unclassified Streptomyces TaxID=2593676 RepID=UPI00035E5AA9|nr:MULTISPECIES: lytic polysaccharide monooxygenase [unclassified Streptomyces]MYT29751.1 LPXTG cell wall anchor domain-containing protein [Streptomyces sp. SID8354]